MTRPTQVICFLTVAILFVAHSTYLSAVAEDAYITFRFGKNMASGSGLVWNIDEPPVEGYTSLSWVLISAAASRTGLNVPLFAQCAGVVAGLVCLAYVYLFCRRLLRLGHRLSLLPCFFLALSGPFATWAASGMETSLFALLVVSSTYHMVSYWRRRRAAALSLGFLLAMLATLTRPEGFGVFCILLGMHCLRALLYGRRRDFTTGILVAAVFYLLPFAAYFAWRFGYYGYMLPNTFYAKTGGTAHQWLRGAKYLSFFGLHFVVPVSPLLAAIVWEAAGRERKANSIDLLTIAKRWIVEYYGILMCLALCLSYTLYVILVGGDYMAMYRFFVPILPLAYILLAYGTKILYDGAMTSPVKPATATILVIIGMVGTLVHSTPLEPKLFAKPGIMHGQYRGVLVERRHSRRLAVIGRFFDTYKRDETESLATGAIGAVSYYSGLRVYGFHGIVDPHIAHRRSKDLGKGLPGHEKADFLYLVGKRPTYFMFTRKLTKGPCAFPEEYSPAVTALLRRDYELVAQWLEDEENGESGYFCFLQRKPEGEHRRSGRPDH